MAQSEKHSEEIGIAFDLNASVTDAIGACGGDLLATIRALVVASNYLAAENVRLTEELDKVWHWISPGYTRSSGRRRMKSGDRE